MDFPARVRKRDKFKYIFSKLDYELSKSNPILLSHAKKKIKLNVENPFILEQRIKNRANDLNKFIGLWNAERRWVYQGSMTKWPFSEGVLWNVVEQVIPVRQSTLDLFIEYRKVVDPNVVDK